MAPAMRAAVAADDAAQSLADPNFLCPFSAKTQACCETLRKSCGQEQRARACYR
jgi:hypothetical protein